VMRGIKKFLEGLEDFLLLRIRYGRERILRRSIPIA
jgi:hypothetical protein